MAAREGELFKDKIEVNLDGKQIFYLFFGGAVIACMVFVLGVMVGRRIEARETAGLMTADPARDPLAALDQLEVDDSPDLAFPAALRGDGGKTPLGLVDATIAQMTADREVAKAAAEKPAADKAPQAAESPPAETADDKPGAEPAAEQAPSVESVEPAAPSKPVQEVTDPSRAKFTLQLSSFQTREEADAFFQELASAGYSPYIVEADVPDKGRWYRVRLGKYATQGDAIAAKTEFETRQRIIAYVTRLKAPQ